MMEGKFSQFAFWSITMRIIKDLLVFVRAIRCGNFELYKYAIEKLLPWLFIHDHFNYARWVSVHLHDLQTLENSRPSVYKEFLNGNFVVSRTSKYFSAMGLDQRQEQHNKDVKGEGGALDLTEDEDNLWRWIDCGPEISKVVKDFEEQTILHERNAAYNFRHHEETPSFQKRRFRRSVAETETEFLYDSIRQCTSFARIIRERVLYACASRYFSSISI